MRLSLKSASLVKTRQRGRRVILVDHNLGVSVSFHHIHFFQRRIGRAPGIISIVENKPSGTSHVNSSAKFGMLPRATILPLE